MMELNDAYQLLNLSPNATPADVKRSFRRLSLKHHPDKNSGIDTAAKMAEVNGAYQLLVARHDEIRNAFEAEQLKKRLISLGTYTNKTQKMVYPTYSSHRRAVFVRPKIIEEIKHVPYSSHFPQITQAINEEYFTVEQLQVISDDKLRFVIENMRSLCHLGNVQCELIMKDPVLLSAFTTHKLVLSHFDARSDEKFKSVITIFKALDKVFFNPTHIAQLGDFGPNVSGITSRKDALDIFASPTASAEDRKKCMRILFDPIISALFSDEAKPELIARQDCLNAIQSGVYSLKSIYALDKVALDTILLPECVEAIQEGVLDGGMLLNMASQKQTKYSETLEQVTSFEYIASLKKLKIKQGEQYIATKPFGYAWHKIDKSGIFVVGKLHHLMKAIHYLPLSPYKDVALRSGIELEKTFNEAERAFIHAYDPMEAEIVFVRTCLEAINTARPALERYHSVRTILLDIANAIIAILTLGIAPIIKGRLRLFEDDRGKNALKSLDEIKQAIDSMPPSEAACKTASALP